VEKSEVSPIIEEYAQKAEFPKQIIKGLGEIGGLVTLHSEEYGGAGLDQISYGIMQKLNAEILVFVLLHLFNPL
jgi:glutaryl-CoA dehydrogenase